MATMMNDKGQARGSFNAGSNGRFGDGAASDAAPGPARDPATSRMVETVAARLALTLARPLGNLVVQPVLDLMMATLRRRHPDAFERLAELGESDLLIEPTDLPASFRLHVGAKPTLRICRSDEEQETPVKARIRGSFAVLLDLFEGRIDGDALFFSRALAIEGDTELVVGLRNALDGEDFDLAADFGPLLGPLATVPLRRSLHRLAGALLDAHALLLAPALRRVEMVERRLGRLEQSGR